MSFPGDALARAEWTNHRLMYLSPELQTDLHLSGRASVTVRMAADREAVNLSVWLVSLPWTESSRRPRGGVITRGWADLQNHASLRDGKPLVPGEFVEMTFDLQPDDQVISAGQQIGLMVFSSDRDFTLWPEPGATLTLDLDGTSLSLPVVGGTQAVQTAFDEQEGTY